MSAVPMNGPLSGLRVLDLTSVIMGPVCTQILAGYGAEVVKVEPPEGDIMRHAGAKLEPGMGAMFLHANRNKRSVVVDLKSVEGQQWIRSAIPKFDVFVHNIRAAAIARIGLDYPRVRLLHPDIVYAELTGYGASGPYADRPAFDDVIQAESGLASLFARQMGTEPGYLPGLIADRMTGITAAHQILAALMRRERTGQGGYLNVAMFETMAEFVLSDHMGQRTFDLSTGQTGYSRLLTAHRKPYRTVDGHIAVIVYNEKHWKSFFEVIGEPQRYHQDERFNSAAARAEHYDTIYRFVSEALASRTTKQWLQILGAAEIPCAPVNSVEDLFDDEHLRSTGFFQRNARDGQPEWAASMSAVVRSGLAPRAGQHTDEYLSKSSTP